VIAVDTNVLVAFQRTEYSTHPRAVQAITELAEGAEAWGIPWPCVHEFLAIVTNPRIFIQPTGLADAADVVDAWLESPVVRLLGESAGYWPALRRLVLAGGVVGARVHDARIAAICLEHGARCLWTADRDFSRFPALRCRNPLVAAPEPDAT
jgi:toxin-antitoxin system PIN domain toxin